MSQPDFAACVGIDWADRKHAACLIEAGSDRPQPCDLPHRAEAIEAWATELRARFGGRPVAVCLEQSRGGLVYALMKYDFLVLFPINPKQLSKYREALSPGGAKDDPSDAELLCRFLREHGKRLRAWRPDDADTRALRLLCESRRNWVAQRTALGNQLLRHLKEAYPLALEFLGKSAHAERFLALLARFPSQRELQRASPQQLARWLPKRRRVVDDSAVKPTSDPRIVALRAAQLLVTDAPVLQAAQLAVKSLVSLLQQLNRTIAEYDTQIAQALAKHPDEPLFRSLPGAGEALRPRLIAALGTDRTRFQSAGEIQQLSGIAPILKRSGCTCVVQRRMFCPKFLRQTFHEFARCSLKKSAWAMAYYRMLRAKGHGFHSAVRALAFKWIRILYHCWKSRCPYQEAHYLERLRLRNSPLLAYLPSNRQSKNT